MIFEYVRPSFNDDPSGVPPVRVTTRNERAYGVHASRVVDEGRWFTDSTGRDHDLAATPSFDLADETQLLAAFATDGCGNVYLLDGQRRVIAVDRPADPDDDASVRATMAWLLTHLR